MNDVFQPEVIHACPRKNTVCGFVAAGSTRLSGSALYAQRATIVDRFDALVEVSLQFGDARSGGEPIQFFLTIPAFPLAQPSIAPLFTNLTSNLVMNFTTTVCR